MTAIAITITAFFFAAVAWAWQHAVIVIPLALIAWSLLLVPDRTWGRIRGAVAAPLRRNHPAPQPAAVEKHRELVHSR